MLDHFGLDPLEEHLYRALLHHSPQSLTDLACAVGVPVALLRAPIERLVSSGFAVAVSDDTDLYVPAPPELALHVAVSREELRLRDRIADLTRLRANVPGLSRGLVGDNSANDDDCLTVIEGPELGRATIAAVAALARERLRVLERDPLTADDLLSAPDVGGQVIYERSVVDDPGQLDRVHAARRHGEAVRLLPRLPARTVIADDHAAIVVVDERPETYRAAVLRPSSLLTSVVALYELLWERAIPLDIPADDSTGWRISDDDVALLRLLAAGLKDQAIARHLGIGLRTVVRRIGNLSRALDAETRFQTGLQAARRGLV